MLHQSSNFLIHKYGLSLSQSFMRHQFADETKMERFRIMDTMKRTPKIKVYNELTPKPFEEVPGPKGLPVLGNLWRYWPFIGKYSFDKIHITYKNMYEEFGPLVKEKLGDRIIVHVFDPNDMSLVYLSENQRPSRLSHRALEKYRRDRPSIFSGPGLFPSNGEEWYRFRRLFQTTLLAPATVNKLADKMECIAKDLVERVPKLLDRQGEVDIQPELFKWAVETIADVTLGVRLGCLSQEGSYEAKKVVEAAHSTHKVIYKTENNPLWKYIPTISYYRLVSAQDFLAKFVKKCMDQATSEPSFHTKNDVILARMFDVSNASEKDIFTMIMDMFMAGIDTTAYTTAFSLYHLAENPDIQEKLFDDLKLHLPTKLHKIVDHKDKLQYLKYVIKESLRLNPVGVGTGRVLSNDLILSGYKIPAGTMIILQHQVASSLSKNFADAEKFIPDRWTKTSRLKAEINGIVSAPFGHGPRICVGMRIAELEMFIVIGQIVRNFKISYYHEKIDCSNRLINVPDKPVKLHFEARRN